MESTKKPRILLCWGYYRKGWIEVFEKLNDQFEFHYLFWMDRDAEREIFTECPRHYWTDFRSGNEVMEKIKPEKVVLMGVNNLLSLAIRFACHNKKIPSYVMQHGLFHDLKTNIHLDEQMAKNKVESKEYTTTQKVYKSRFFQLWFILRSLGWRNWRYIWHIGRWQLDDRRMSQLKALAKHQHSFRRADKYIVYTKFNGHFFKEVDGITEERMIPVGVPEFDSFFQEEQHTAPVSKPYYLLIDSALTYNEVFKTHGVVDQETYNDFLSRVNDAAIEEGKKLVIKLHPFSYNNTRFLQHPNIEYVHDTDIVKIIREADHILGFDSTLMLIAMYLKPTVLFTIHDFGYLQTNVKAMNIAPVLPYDNFTADDIRKALAFKPTAEAKKLLVERFLYATDGYAYKRVGEVLAAPAN